MTSEYQYDMSSCPVAYWDNTELLLGSLEILRAGYSQGQYDVCRSCYYSLYLGPVLHSPAPGLPPG
jgi:hypothetical protein